VELQRRAGTTRVSLSGMVAQKSQPGMVTLHSVEPLREADCSFLAKKYRSLCCHAARLCGHFHGRHPQVRHRVAVCTRLARPRVPTSTTTTLSDIRRPGAVRKQPLTTTQALISRLVQEEASYAVKIGNDNSHNTPTDFISTSTAFIAQPLTA
jgi:hypothetical protein